MLAVCKQSTRLKRAAPLPRFAGLPLPPRFTQAVESLWKLTATVHRLSGSVLKYTNQDATVRFWVTKQGAEAGLEPKLDAAVREWIKTKWPFKKVAYPGRDGQ